MINRSYHKFFVITRSISLRPISDLGQALAGPILESRADRSGDNEKPVIITMSLESLSCPPVR